MSETVQEAFDELAPTYDEVFTGSVIGRLQREAVWRWVEPLFGEGNRVLDLGCGTGEDAVRLARRGARVVALDVSPLMALEAANRAAAEDLSDRIETHALAIERLDQLDAGPFDGAVSNFGPLNCLQDLRPTARALAERVRPGGRLALCLMSRFCLWETLFYPFTLQIHKAIRRWSGDWAPAKAGGEATFPVYYPAMRDVRRAFAPWFRLTAAPGVGVFVPPTYLEPFAARHARLMRTLAGLDRRVAHRPGFRAVADHRLALLTRTDVASGSRRGLPGGPARRQDAPRVSNAAEAVDSKAP